VRWTASPTLDVRENMGITGGGASDCSGLRRPACGSGGNDACDVEQRLEDLLAWAQIPRQSLPDVLEGNR